MIVLVRNDLQMLCKRSQIESPCLLYEPKATRAQKDILNTFIRENEKRQGVVLFETPFSVAIETEGHQQIIAVCAVEPNNQISQFLRTLANSKTQENVSSDLLVANDQVFIAMSCDGDIFKLHLHQMCNRKDAGPKGLEKSWDVPNNP